jgi:hypothetical protein
MDDSLSIVAFSSSLSLDEDNPSDLLEEENIPKTISCYSVDGVDGVVVTHYLSFWRGKSD